MLVWFQLNPLHTIPVLDDGGKIIRDSHAIIPYLADKYGKNDSLYPKDHYRRAIINQKLHFDSGSVAMLLPPVLVIVFISSLFESLKKWFISGTDDHQRSEVFTSTFRKRS